MKQTTNASCLLTDLYEFTMAAAYLKNRRFAPASFSLFIREYPPDRGYFVSAGLEDVLSLLETFQYDRSDLEYLESSGLFGPDFLHYLSGFRFSGDVRAMPEGRIFFKNEPILEVTAPIIEAQLVESLVINLINLQVMIATKASRCRQAARGRKLVDFSLRRTQGVDAAVKVARASYIGGFEGTSNVLAGQRYGIPINGTMAHSFITSFEDEEEAFRAFYETFPENTVLLIDTYDTVQGGRKAAQIGTEMAQQGYRLKGIRLDSGDMAELSKTVRMELDAKGLEDVGIFASGGFDEFKIADALDRGAQIDAFGVGTKMGVSADAPYTDIAYKLVQYDGRPVLKLSSGKKTLVGEKQVFRQKDGSRPVQDVIALKDETITGDPLLGRVMAEGVRKDRPESLAQIKDRFEKDFSELDNAFKALKNPERYPIVLGPGLERLQKEVIHRTIIKELGES
ncbi:MAG: nicotinate phosphoribosyltransferase [Desulfatiglandales bacterium]